MLIVMRHQCAIAKRQRSSSKRFVMARYDQSKMNVYRSDYDGGISLNFDAPTSIRISTARNDGRRYWHQVFSPSIDE